LVIVNHKIVLVSFLKQNLLVLRRNDQPLFKFFCGHILLQYHRFNANDGFCIYMSVVILVTGSDVDEQHIILPQIIQ
jgi:hypothetical protein